MYVSFLIRNERTTVFIRIKCSHTINLDGKIPFKNSYLYTIGLFKVKVLCFVFYWSNLGDSRFLSVLLLRLRKPIIFNNSSKFLFYLEEKEYLCHFNELCYIILINVHFFCTFQYLFVDHVYWKKNLISSST